MDSSDSLIGTDQSYVSWLWRTSNRSSGVSWWGERPSWVRHVVYWLVASGILAISVFDTAEPAHDGQRSLGGAAVILWFFGIMLIGGVVAVVREWDYLSVARSLSRVLVLLVLLIGVLAGLLVLLEADVTVTVDATVASPTAIVEMLAWNAADVVPALDVQESLAWDRPAATSDSFAGAAVIIVRAFVAVVLLAGVKRLWDRYTGLGDPPSRPNLKTPGHWLTHPPAASSPAKSAVSE